MHQIEHGRKVQCFYCNWIRELDRPEPIIMKYLFKPTNHFFCSQPQHKEKRRNQFSVYSRRNCTHYQDRDGDLLVEAPSTPIFPKCMFCGFIYTTIKQVKSHRKSCEGWIKHERDKKVLFALSKKRKEDEEKMEDIVSYLADMTEDLEKKPPSFEYHRDRLFNRWIDEFIDRFAVELTIGLPLDEDSFLSKKIKAFLENHHIYTRINKKFYPMFNELRKQGKIDDYVIRLYFSAHRLRCQMFGFILILKPMVDDEKRGASVIPLPSSSTIQSESNMLTKGE